VRDELLESDVATREVRKPVGDGLRELPLLVVLQPECQGVVAMTLLSDAKS